jgi:hypothetical protein
MSYGVMPYSIPWDTLKSLFGSKDQNLYNQVVEKNQYQITELEDMFDYEDNKPGDYVLDIINGTVNYDNGALYGYAFEMICKTIGHFMNNNEWCPTDYWYEISYVLTNSKPFSLPIPDDFPDYRVISPENMPQIISNFEEITAISAKAKKQFLQWLTYCQESNCALVLFYH